MGERAKVIVNNYTALDIMKRPDFDINKFYGSDIRLFIKVAINEIKKIDEIKKKYNKCYQDKINLNNIINELEKYLNEQVDYMTHHSIERMVAFDCCRHKLQELKGDSSNGNN